MGCMPSRKGDSIKETIIRKETATSPQLILNQKGKVSDNYKIIEQLWSGKIGKIFRVEHNDTGILRAMKAVKKSKLQKNLEFLNEVYLLSKLDHPNIMKVYELYEDDSNYYIICELCSGGELFEKITHIQAFNEKVAARIMKQLISALYYLHSNNIAHGNIKPQHILLELNKKGTSIQDSKVIKVQKTYKATMAETISQKVDINDINIKLIDFGNSLHKTDSTDEVVSEAVFYQAPETFNKMLCFQSDIWSAGVLLYIMLSGLPPFDGEGNEEIENAIRKGEFDYEGEEFEDVSKEAKDLINKMLILDPKKRISSSDILKHKWITTNDEKIMKSQATNVNQSSLNRIVTNLKTFQIEKKFHQATVAFIVHHLSSAEETQKLREIFQTFDKNGDGRLTYEELFEGLKKNDGEFLAKDEIKAFIQSLDQDNNGYIEYEEFLRANINLQTAFTEKNLLMAFKMFDRDNDGSISYAELKGIFGSDVKNHFIDSMLTEIGRSKEVAISFENFKSIMLSILEKR